ncbi:hypothetical protein BW686_24200 [Pseudomonas syringae]|uniref:Uncharacterized protein n=1 Tax=Pseudomonas syringae TaxID=317 RepID=A0A244ELK6_PSESX|nr:hypothetical protein BW686_24200 [Pseudomonas syringae]
MILAGGRGSERVRERVSVTAENASTDTPSSRTSSLPRPSGRSLEALYSGRSKACITMSLEHGHESERTRLPSRPSGRSLEALYFGRSRACV